IHFVNQLIWVSSLQKCKNGNQQRCGLCNRGHGLSWFMSGYTVRTTVRSNSDKSRDLGYLTNLPGAKENLQIFNADLTQPESFNEAIEGCTGVFHMAHHFDHENQEPEDIVVNRSIQATLGILKACLNSKTVKRVVYTSSAAAVSFNGNGQDTVDESVWSDLDYCKSMTPVQASYVVAKTKTEKAALEFAEQNGMDLVTVIPCLTVGPFICPRIPSSDEQSSEGKLPSLSSKKLLESGFQYKYGARVEKIQKWKKLKAWCVSLVELRLLERDYTVRTTIRPDPEGKRDISYLTNLPGAAERLQIFYADLIEPESFNEAIEGCTGVFHLAFPIDLAGKEPEEVVTKRAVEGTLGILKSCLNSKTVKRVIYESSQAAVMFTGKEEDREVVDENAWTDIDYYRSLNRYGTAYLAAKTTTSKAAVEFAARNGLDLVVTRICILCLSRAILCIQMMWPGRSYISLRILMPKESTYRKKDISYITNLPGASDKLKIFNADLSQPDSFKAAIEGCIGVFHVAHPMEFEGKQHEEVITKMAVDGLLGILRSCLDSKTVKRFVYTSTAATVMFNGKGLMLVDENTWSDLDICRSNEFSFLTPYYVSKTLTEKTALEFAETNGLELVTVILPLVVGPFICPAIPASVALALGFILGYQKQYIGRNNWNVVHIDDAIRAHIYLLENSEAKGRYICSSVHMELRGMTKFLSEKYPQYPVPEMLHKKEKEDRFFGREMEGDKGTVCVTAGTGFLASWLIKTLLQDGYSVHATVRPDPEHKRDVSFLTSLPRASQKLKIFEADLSNPDNFEDAIKGCGGVFHVATPVDFTNQEPEAVVTKRAIEGTLDILRACLNAKTVKRVVYTSSAST
ncbi:hypothetical protein Tsubulata_019065, partial [Turnera subulata]